MAKFRPFAAILVAGVLACLSAVSRSAENAVDPGQQQYISQLGPGDSVSVQVYGQDATSAYVADDGTISVPLIGNIQVAGMSPIAAAGRVAKALKDGGFFVDPHVTILVTQVRSQLVSVLGEVGSSGRYPINPRTTIVDLLAQAGGVKETASDVGYVLRTDSSGHATRYPVKLNGSADLKDILPNATLLGGDSLVVPRAGHFYAFGEVSSPGTYRLEPGMTLIQAIARAGGVNERGSERRIQVQRLGKDGQYKVVRLKLNDPIEDDDIIRVKESIF